MMAEIRDNYDMINMIDWNSMPHKDAYGNRNTMLKLIDSNIYNNTSIYNLIEL